ncbi:MAG: hotdog fold thioesterase [Pseudomonadota bacterium]
MKIWKTQTTVEAINALCQGTMCEHIGLVITELGDDYLRGTLPVDSRTQQHMGIIHGGASVVLAETLGSIGSTLCCPEGFHIVGLDINANHIRAGKPPYVTGTARALHVGSSTMVWEIKITDVEDKLVCVSRLTCAVLKNR